MKYVCATCNKVFLHTAKTVKALDGKGERGVIMGNMAVQVDTVESAVCPFCHSLEYEEFIVTEGTITSLKSVPLEDVDDYLKKDYVVKDTFAKTATLIKREEAKTQ